MVAATHVSFRHLKHSPAIEQLIRNKVSELEKVCGDISSCQVVVALASKHHLHGNQYDVTIDFSLPGQQFTANHTPAEHAELQELEVVIHRAFDKAERQLKDYVQRRTERRHGTN